MIALLVTEQPGLTDGQWFLVGVAGLVLLVLMLVVMFR